MVFHESAVRDFFIAGICFFYDQYVRKYRFNYLGNFGIEDVA